MSAEILVGVDVGTTSIKALAVSLEGRVLGEAATPTPWQHSGPHSQIAPRLLADTAIAVCAEAVAAAAAAGTTVVRAIGVTGIAETGALLDAHGEPCAPALAWFDPRGLSAPIKEAVTAREFQRATGRRLNSKPSIAKIAWLQRSIPSASSAVRHLCVAEWVVRALGGDEVAEASLSSRTGLLELATRSPWSVASSVVGDLLTSNVVWAGDPAGRVGEDAPAALRGAVLTVAGLDHQAAVFISGAARDGALFDSMGTAEALIRTVAQPLDADTIERLTDHDIDVDWSVLPDHQILLAGRLTGLTLERVAGMLGATDRDARRALGEAALGSTRGSDGPRLVGVGNDSVSIEGITDGVSPALVWRAAVEDLGELAGQALAQMSRAAGPHTSAVLAGGWSRNPMVADSKRRQLGDYVASNIQEPGALGAAFLGGVAAGLLDRPGVDGLPSWR